MRPVSAWAITAAWTCTAPLGRPVVPEVKWMSATSSSPVRAVSKRSGAAVIAGPSATQPSGASACEAASAISTSRSEGRLARQSATLRRYCAAVVTSAEASPISIRARTGPGPKAAKRGVKVIPALSVPSAAA